MKGHAGKEIIAWQWRSGQDTVGIVHYKNEIGQHRVVIGVAQFHDEVTDINYIADYGAKLTFSEASAFFNDLKEGEYKS